MVNGQARSESLAYRLLRTRRSLLARNRSLPRGCDGTVVLHRNRIIFMYIFILNNVSIFSKIYQFKEFYYNFFLDQKVFILEPSFFQYYCTVAASCRHRLYCAELHQCDCCQIAAVGCIGIDCTVQWHRFNELLSLLHQCDCCQG